MPPDFHQLPTRLGVYTLTRHLGRRAWTDLYLATQSHVERGVVVEVLRPECNQQETDLFLHTARARAAAQLPHVSQVYETMVSHDIWYLTLERPKGKSLSQLAAAGERLQNVQQACSIIIAAAELYQAAAEQNIAADGLAGESIFIKGKDEISFLSPVLPGPHAEELVPTQMETLAASLEAVLPANVPGQNRIATLLNWMREGYEGQKLEWRAIASTANLICEQLTPVLEKSLPTQRINLSAGSIKRQAQRNRRKTLRLLGVSAIALIGVAAIGGLGLLFAPKDVPELPPAFGNYVACQHGQGTARMLARPVSISEYQKFLAVLDNDKAMTPQRRSSINKDIPENKQRYTPLDWDAQLQAAERGKKWNGEKLSPHSPVRGVSYWDALAYANYKQGAIPTAEQLQAVRQESGIPEKTEEWTASIIQAAPLYTAGRFILPSAGKANPTIEPDPAARRPNYGFRILIPDSPLSDDSKS